MRSAPVIKTTLELEVKTVGLGSNIITGSHGISVLTDLVGEEINLDENLDMIILPGGMPGTLNLEASVIVKSAINYCIDNNKIVTVKISIKT